MEAVVGAPQIEFPLFCLAGAATRFGRLLLRCNEVRVDGFSGRDHLDRSYITVIGVFTKGGLDPILAAAAKGNSRDKFSERKSDLLGAPPDCLFFRLLLFCTMTEIAYRLKCELAPVPNTERAVLPLASGKP